jgi:hypothetical protein
MRLRRLPLLSLCLVMVLGAPPMSAVAQPQPGMERHVGDDVIARASAELRHHLRLPTYKICVVSQPGMASCLTAGAFRDFNRRLLTPDQAKFFNDLFDEFARENGVGRGGEMFVACHGRWRAVDVRASDARTSPASTSGAALSAIEQRAVLNSCGANAGGGGRPGGADLGANTGRQRQIDKAVADMDSGFSTCRDSATSGWVGQLTDREKNYIRMNGIPVDKIPGTSTPNPFGRHVDINSQPTNEIIFKGAFLKAILALGEWAKEQERKKEAEELAKLEAEITAKEIEEAAKAQEREEQEKEGRASEEEEKAAQQCLQGTQCVESTAPKPGYPAPDGTGATCAERQARWERFKTHCERSNWREFRCEQFLRLVNGCVDVTTILPTPEGDATCTGRTTEDERRRVAAARECAKRSMIAMPGDDGVMTCRSDLTDLRSPVADICSDPRARPGQDQCLGGSMDRETERGRGGRPSPGRPGP